MRGKGEKEGKGERERWNFSHNREALCKNIFISGV